MFVEELKVNGMPSSENLAHSDATRAIGLCRTGAVEDGIALYQKVLKKRPWSLPVGVHLKFLQSLGLPGAADIIRRSALAQGADICTSEMLGRPSKVIVDEY